MTAIKITWTKTDTFKTFHERLKFFVGKKVYANPIDKKPFKEKVFTIVSVDFIVKSEIESWNGIVWRRKSVWSFDVSCKELDISGRTITTPYKFHIPRNSETLEDDLKNNSIVVDSRHPFVFYDKSLLTKNSLKKDIVLLPTSFEDKFKEVFDNNKVTKKRSHYEARLKRNISRSPYGLKKVYKKGTLICDFSEKQFNKITAKNIHKYSDLCLCEGHGVYEYFDLEKDIQFFKVETITSKNETIIKLKK